MSAIGRCFGFVAAVGVLLLASGCTSGSDRVPTAGRLETAGLVRSSLEVGQLRRGRAYLIRECTGCHRLFEPSELTPEGWQRVLPRMLSRTSLGFDQALSLEEYIFQAARFAQETSVVPQETSVVPQEASAK